MRICVVNSKALSRAFESLGHEVLALEPGPGPRNLPALLDEDAFAPDLLLEVEHLGPRTILTGLSSLSCAKLFWSVDTHLNAWWHRAYGRLFDAVMTTQDSWMPRLRRMGLGAVEHLPWYGTRRPWRPWSGRTRGLCFVGRVTGERPVRRRMVQFLAERHGLEHVDGADYQEMMALYDGSRLVPNEAIFSEVNFRLFEAASCGCLVLNQAVSSDIGRVFEPGREVAVYEDVLELDALANHYTASPRQAEVMGRAAWERVNAQHLAVHRAARILEYAERHAGSAPRGPFAEAFAWEAVFRLNEAGMFESNLKAALDSMVHRRFEPDGFAALLRLMHFMDGGDEALSLMQEVLADEVFCGDFEVNFTASVLARRLGRDDLAKAFWLRHALSLDRGRPPEPEGEVAFWSAWAAQCERHWLSVSSGFLYKVGVGVPHAAMECLMEANELDPGNLDVVRSMNAILAAEGSGGYGMRLHALSHLGLHLPDDWRLGLELGLTNLRGMRLKEGLEELVLASDAAERAGETARFQRALAAHDRRGVVALALAQALGKKPTG